MRIDLTDPIAVLLAVQAAFERAGLRFAAYGGLVGAMYGRPRETHDADLAVSTLSCAEARAALVTGGFDALEAFADVRFGGCTLSRLTLVGGSELNTVDLVRPRSARFASIVIDRAVVGPLRSQEIRVTTPEDYILLKVLATRDRDLEDAIGVVEKQRSRLDWPLLEHEVRTLAREIPDHDVAGRFATVSR